LESVKNNAAKEADKIKETAEDVIEENYKELSGSNLT
jgi:hypothetical protein